MGRTGALLCARESGGEKSAFTKDDGAGDLCVAAAVVRAAVFLFFIFIFSFYAYVRVVVVRARAFSR